MAKIRKALLRLEVDRAHDMALRSLKRLVRLLRTEDNLAWVKATFALREFGPRAVNLILDQLRRTKVPHQRSRMIAALGVIGESAPDVALLVLSQIAERDPDPIVRETAARAIADLRADPGGTKSPR